MHIILRFNLLSLGFQSQITLPWNHFEFQFVLSWAVVGVYIYTSPSRGLSHFGLGFNEEAAADDESISQDLIQLFLHLALEHLG